MNMKYTLFLMALMLQDVEQGQNDKYASDLEAGLQE